MFFSLIYIQPNRFSEEKIAVGIIGNENNIPFIFVNELKLSFALKLVHKDIRYIIRKSIKLLCFDIMKYREGRASLPLFDETIGLKYLKGLKKNNQGKIQYGDPVALEQPIDLNKLINKYIGSNHKKLKIKKTNPLIKLEFKGIGKFERNFSLREADYPELFATTKLDLFSKGKFFITFDYIDFSKSPASLRNYLSKYFSTINALQEHAANNGMAKGRHYLVYSSDQFVTNAEMILKIKRRGKSLFEIIPINEIKDKI